MKRCSGSWRNRLSLILLLALYPTDGYALDSKAGVILIPNPIKRSGAGSLFRISRKEKWGYMDRTGATIIAPQFDWEGDFMGGLARALIDGKWGYINERGHMVIPPQFDDAGDFTGELAPVQVARKWGYIDKHGLLAITPQFQGAGEFHEGLARFEVWETIICAQGPW